METLTIDPRDHDELYNFPEELLGVTVAVLKMEEQVFFNTKMVESITWTCYYNNRLFNIYQAIAHDEKKPESKLYYMPLINDYIIVPEADKLVGNTNRDRNAATYDTD